MTYPRLTRYFEINSNRIPLNHPVAAMKPQIQLYHKYPSSIDSQSIAEGYGRGGETFRNTTKPYSKGVLEPSGLLYEQQYFKKQNAVSQRYPQKTSGCCRKWKRNYERKKTTTPNRKTPKHPRSAFIDKRTAREAEMAVAMAVSECKTREQKVKIFALVKCKDCKRWLRP